MTITTITPTRPACYGVVCPEHAQCRRYAEVETTTEPHTIATCDDNGTGQRPLFLAIQREMAEA